MFGQLILICIMILLVLGAIFFLNSPPKPITNKPSQEENLWEEQKKQSQKESQVEKNKEWFSEKRWITDKEIDWATEQIYQGLSEKSKQKYKILPAHQFHYVAETKGTNEANAHLAFPELLSELNCSAELVFIPVNNPDFHWSLLVYETKSQTFYHFDTLRGANYDYIKPLIEELLSQIHQNNNLSLSDYLIPQHHIQQKNTFDCGIAIIDLTSRIIKLHPGLTPQQYIGNLSLGQFDFAKSRKELRTKYLAKNETD